MQGRSLSEQSFVVRKGDAGRCKAAGPKKPEAYSLEYVEDFFGRERRRCCQIVCRSRMELLGQTPRSRSLCMDRTRGILEALPGPSCWDRNSTSHRAGCFLRNTGTGA